MSWGEWAQNPILLTGQVLLETNLALGTQTSVWAS